MLAPHSHRLTKRLLLKCEFSPRALHIETLAFCVIKEYSAEKPDYTERPESDTSDEKYSGDQNNIDMWVLLCVTDSNMAVCHLLQVSAFLGVE